jgi:tetratricopeptide (TPR) repeat protein
MKHLLYISVVLFLFGCNETQDIKNTEAVVVDSIAVQEELDLETINKKLRKDPNNSILYYQRAQVLLEQKQPDDAMNDIERSLDLDSVNADYLLFKSELFFRKGSGFVARELIQKSIDNNPNHIDSYLKMAEIQLYTRQYEESIQNVNNALKVDMYNSRAYFLKGMNYKYAGDTAKAVSSFQTATEQNPDYYEAYIQLGLIYSVVSDPLAVSYYNNALKLKPKSTEALYNKSLFLQENGKEKEAIVGYRLINKFDPTYKAAYYNIGFIYLVMQENYDSSIVYFNKALKLSPNYFDAAYNIGYSYELKGDRAIAKEFYAKTLALKTDHTLAAKGLSRVE